VREVVRRAGGSARGTGAEEQRCDSEGDDLEGMIRSSNTRAACAAIRTLGEYITGSCSFGALDDSALNGSRSRALGLLLAGLAHYDETVRHETENVIGGSLFASDLLPPEAKSFLFGQIHKKLLVLLYEQPESRLTLFNTAATLNRIYRYVTEREVSRESFDFEPQGAAAFFPGTFDPFSSGHKRIVSEIRALGAEVYLAVDEFSWSKKTQPTLIRRQIVNMSTADQFGVYLFPGDIPVNLSNPGDLARLRGLFPKRQLYIVVGSDVVQNASAYSDPSAPGSVCDYDHIVFMRAADESDRQEKLPENRIRGKVIDLSLPPFYEDVSSTRIRENIDKNLDISMMVDPMVQEYIYLNSLYVRAPQYKTTVDPKTPELIYTGGTRGAHVSGYATLLRKMGVKLDPARDNRAVISGSPDGPDLGFAVSHTVNTGGLFEELSDISAAENVRQKISGKILVIDRVYSRSADDTERSQIVNELLARSLNDDHTYAMVRCKEDDALGKVFERKGFKPLPGGDGILVADMRSPMIFIEDALQTIKEPLCFDPAVADTVRSCRVRLQNALTELFPGRLLLSFDSGALNRMLIKKVMEYNGAADIPDHTKNVGRYMCVPYGKILSDSVVPHTVTKTLHVEKVFERDISDFGIMEYPGYSPIAAQIDTIASFGRPVILVDDLLHKGYRLEKLDSMLKSSSVEIKKIMVGILSGRGRDLMELTGRDADCVYFIPNLSYWFTESLEYPFIGGDSIKGGSPAPGYLLPSVNLILPYKMPDYVKNASPGSLYRLSLCSLENARDILQTLERRHQALFERSLTLGRLGEALHRPRIPDKGSAMKYDPGVLPSQYVEDDIKLLLRIGGTER
jgi:nicotinic acid mononucleotide adenylyltransferase